MSEHGEDWTDWTPSDDGPSCKCGFNGSPTDCATYRAFETEEDRKQ